MRRSDKRAEHPDLTGHILSSVEVGHLGIITPEGRPRVIPVNFVADGTTIYFHGAAAGQKYEALVGSPLVCFNVSIAYSVIPSFWLAAENARGATQFYESVQIDGRASVVTDRSEKAVALQLLMLKYQPEGGFREITPHDEFYRKALEETAVIRIEAEKVETKVNLGQQHSDRVRRDLIGRLEQRGTEADVRTAAAMRAMLDGGDPVR